MNKNSFLATSLISLVCLLSACATQENITGKPIPLQIDRSSINQFAKNDMDRMADIEMRENTESLRILMTKLYKRNPRELQKSLITINASKIQQINNVGQMVDWVFTNNVAWQFELINNLQGASAIFLAFNQDNTGDRVLPFIVGLQTMLIKAHGGKTEHFLTDNINPQIIYNVARNIEVAGWKLSSAHNAEGNLYLISNQTTSDISDKSSQASNLSFEREFGKMIGRADLYAIALE